MSDGDKVYGGALPPRYQEPYEALCEGRHDSRSIAHSLLDAVRRDLRQFGILPLELLRQEAQRLDELSQRLSIQATTPWPEERRQVERLARTIAGHPRGMGLAVDECKRYLLEVQEGMSFLSHVESLVQRYFVRVYDAQFQDRAPLDNHHNGIDQSVFLERLHEVRPFVIETLHHWADVVIRTWSLAQLRRPQELTPQVDANTNLLEWL